MNLPVTERRNPRSMELDKLPALEIAKLINDEDARVAGAVRRELPAIGRAVELIISRLQQNGRLFYFGAGTSGRIGVLDASELPPTFGTSPQLVQAYIAGGDGALRRSAERVEDDFDGGKSQVYDVGVTAHDVVLGIAASGRTPWVLGAMIAAREVGAHTVALTCVPNSPLSHQAQITIAPIVGPEVIAGSSRMKAGTAQKMILNMISTATMVRLGKVYSNLMVDLQTTNVKLRQRAVEIVCEATGVGAEEAQETLESTGGDVKAALVMLLLTVNVHEARARLQASGGVVHRAIEKSLED